MLSVEESIEIGWLYLTREMDAGALSDKIEDIPESPQRHEMDSNVLRY